MGDTRRYAERMNLIDMLPLGRLASTGYALASPGREYLVLQPSEAADPFTVQLGAGSYTSEWYSVKTRETQKRGTMRVERDGPQSVTPPFAGPAVLYLKRDGR